MEKRYLEALNEEKVLSTKIMELKNLEKKLMKKQVKNMVLTCILQKLTY